MWKGIVFFSSVRERGVSGAPKIVIIGAGSVVFAQKLITDIITFPALRGSTLTLVDIDEEWLELITKAS